jgi:hypothetical protein
MSVVYTHKVILFNLKSENPMHVTAWTKFENILLSEISQTQKDRYYMISFIWGTKNRHIHRDRK